MAPWSPGSRVVVIGAGATRGAQFVEDGKPPLCLPPLNTDFFTQLQRIRAAKHERDVENVLNDVLTLYGPNFDLTLEQYFTQLEAMIATIEASSSSTVKFSVERLRSMRTRLLNGLSAVLEQSADVAKATSKPRTSPCQYHAKVVELLDPKDTIISFNYDCVIDHALRTSGGGKWSARYGYCFPNPDRVEGSVTWDAANPPDRHNRSINLLKLHGSLNWFPFPPNDAQPIRLRERPYKQAGNKEYEIIPPEYVKSFHERPIFKQLWTNAELAIRKAQTLALIGFSFTPTDLHVEALFRVALADRPALEHILIVNPSHEHRQRIRSVLTAALGKGARVTQFDRFRDAYPHLPELLSS